MSAIRRRPLVQQSRVPLGVHLRLRRRRRLLHRFHLAASEAARGMGGEAELLRQPERRSRRGASRRSRPTSGAEASGLTAATRRSSGRRADSRTSSTGSSLISRRIRCCRGRRLDFERFASVCRLAWRRALIGAGMVSIEIVELVRGMNPSGKRRYDAEAILASLRKQGEGIVCASGNGGITRSSDLHEWRNDLGAVSSRDPVKL